MKQKSESNSHTGREVRGSVRNEAAIKALKEGRPYTLSRQERRKRFGLLR